MEVSYFMVTNSDLHPIWNTEQQINYEYFLFMINIKAYIQSRIPTSKINCKYFAKGLVIIYLIKNKRISTAYNFY